MRAIRHWLIRVLAGRDVVVLNAHLKPGEGRI